MEKKEFKVKVIYGSEDGLDAYNNDGTIFPFVMVGEFTFASQSILDAFLDGTIERGGFDKYVVLERIKVDGKTKFKILFGKKATEDFKEFGEIKNGTILNFEFEYEAEIYIFFQALDIAVKYSYNQIVLKTMTRNEVIEKLALSEVKNIQGSNIINEQFISDLIVKGWKGYDSFTNKELEADFCNAFNEDIEIID